MHSFNILLIFNLLIILNSCIRDAIAQKLFSKAKLHTKCKQIGPTNDLDMEWAMSMFAGKTFYLTMGSASAYEDLSELLSGKKAANTAELNKMCSQVRIKGFKSTIEAYDGRFLVIDCAMITKGVQECTANSKTEFPARHKKVKAIQTLAWTDNKANMILVRCTPDGKKNDWLLYSTNTTISPATKTLVQEQATKLGFPHLPKAKKNHVHHAEYKSCTFPPEKDDD